MVTPTDASPAPLLANRPPHTLVPQSRSRTRRRPLGSAGISRSIARTRPQLKPSAQDAHTARADTSLLATWPSPERGLHAGVATATVEVAALPASRCCPVPGSSVVRPDGRYKNQDRVRRAAPAPVRVCSGRRPIDHVSEGRACAHGGAITA